VSVPAFGTRIRGFHTGPKPTDFSGEKFLSASSFGGELKPSVPCRKFTAYKGTQKVTWKSPLSAKFSANFSPIVPPSAAGARLRRFRLWGLHVARVLERSNHWSSRLGGLTCRWQRHSVKTFLLRILNDS